MVVAYVASRLRHGRCDWCAAGDAQIRLDLGCRPQRQGGDGQGRIRRAERGEEPGADHEEIRVVVCPPIAPVTETLELDPMRWVPITCPAPWIS